MGQLEGFRAETTPTIPINLITLPSLLEGESHQNHDSEQDYQSMAELSFYLNLLMRSMSPVRQLILSVW